MHWQAAAGVKLSLGEMPSASEAAHCRKEAAAVVVKLWEPPSLDIDCDTDCDASH